MSSPARNPAGSREKARHVTVYVVDDDAAVRDSLCLLLEARWASRPGLTARRRNSSPATIRAARLPVLDVRMPGMSGLELQQELNRRGTTIPVIFITGHGDVPMAVEAMRHGAFEFLQKPFREQDLLDCVQRAIARDSQNRAPAGGEKEQIRAQLSHLTRREEEVLNWWSRARPTRWWQATSASASARWRFIAPT